jgi:mannose-6-phosphate isomerase-like protein (cupin superfamily)
MTQFINSPSVVKAAGNKEKIIREFFGKVNSKTSEVSIAQMISPEGWEEPGQQPEFNEYTVVLKGKLMISTKTEEFILSEGQGIMTEKNEWVKYSTPFKGGAEYIAICLPAFSMELVKRDKEEYF